MAGKNRVELTLAGDHDQLTKVFSETESAADQMAAKVGDASKRMADGIGSGAKRVSEELDTSTRSLDDLGGGIDNVGQKGGDLESGFRGITDSMSGFAQIAEGDVMAGLTDMAGGVEALSFGMVGVLVPAAKAAKEHIASAGHAAFEFVTSAKGAAFAVGGLGLALGAAFLIYQSFIKETEAASIRVDRLDRDLRLLTATGQLSGDAAKALDFSWQDATDGLDARTIPIVGKYAEQLQRVTTGNEHLDLAVRGVTGNLDGWSNEAGEAADKLLKLEDALVGMIEQGESSERVMTIAADAAAILGVSTEELIGRMPELAAELERVESEHKTTTEAIRVHTRTMQEFSDSLRAQTDPIFAVVNAQQQQHDAVVALDEAIKLHGEHSEEARLAQLDLAQAELGLAGAVGDASGAVGRELIPALRRMRDDGHLSEGAFEALVDEIRRAERAAESLNGTRVQVFVDQLVSTVTSAFGGPRPRQHGGPLAPWMLVGEEGPEIISGQQVIAHQQSMAMLQQQSRAGMVRAEDGSWVPRSFYAPQPPAPPPPRRQIGWEDLQVPTGAGLDAMFLTYLQELLRRNGLVLVPA